MSAHPSFQITFICQNVSARRCVGPCQHIQVPAQMPTPFPVTLVTLGRLTDVSFNKNGGSREAVKNKGSVWVEGERIRSPFLTRRKITHKPNHSRNEFSLHLILFEIFEIQNPTNWGLLKTVWRLTEPELSGDWGLLVKWNLLAIPTFHLLQLL